jgi:type IV pilus assembly protein PilO
MNQDKISLSKTDLSVPVVKKKKYTFEDFTNSFNSLDPQNMGNWPWPVKITILIFAMLMTLALAYFLMIRPVMDQIDGARTQEETLLTEYREKDSKLRNLQLYEVQVNQMEETFGQLLRQLPKESEIPGLIEDINYTGVGSGMQFNDIKVEPEITREFFIELPISIKGQGDYHSFGGFISGLAALPRIVTVHDFDIAPINKTTKDSVEVPVLNMTLQARTYRYNDQVDPKATSAMADSVQQASQGGAPK